jgi:hypothetical protein
MGARAWARRGPIGAKLAPIMAVWGPELGPIMAIWGPKLGQPSEATEQPRTSTEVTSLYATITIATLTRICEKSVAKSILIRQHPCFSNIRKHPCFSNIPLTDTRHHAHGGWLLALRPQASANPIAHALARQQLTPLATTQAGQTTRP